MDIAKSFTFMFEDPDWLRKLGIGVVVMLVGIVLSPVLIGLIPLVMVAGYTLEVTRNVLDGRANPLPEWEDWGGLLARGLKLAAVFIIWSLPLLLLAFPFGLGAVLSDNSRDGSFLGSMLIACGSCLAVLWGLVLMVFSPAIYVRLARTDSIASGLDVARLWTFTRDNITNVIIAVLLTFVAGIIASIAAWVGLIALVIGVLVTMPLAILWQYLVQAHLYGQIGNRSVSPVV